MSKQVVLPFDFSVCGNSDDKSVCFIGAAIWGPCDYTFTTLKTLLQLAVQTALGKSDLGERFYVEVSYPLRMNIIGEMSAGVTTSPESAAHDIYLRIAPFGWTEALSFGFLLLTFKQQTAPIDYDMPCYGWISDPRRRWTTLHKIRNALMLEGSNGLDMLKESDESKTLWALESAKYCEKIE